MIQSLPYHHIVRKAVLGLGVTVMIVAMLCVKASYNARQEFARGEAAYQGGQYQEAIMSYERAIKWYTPLSTSVRFAVERLWDIGTDAEQQADEHLALQAYRSLRSSLYAVQSFYLPYQHWIPKSEAKIAALMAKIAQAEGQDGAKRAHDTARFAQMLQRDIAPNMGWSVLVELGFLGWVGATVGLIWYAFGKNSVWAWRPGLVWGSGIVVCFAMWIVGMLFT